MNNATYQKPILARIFRVLGWIEIVTAVFCALQALASSHLEFLVPIFGLFISALFFFGIAEILNLLGRSAWNIERITAKYCGAEATPWKSAPLPPELEAAVAGTEATVPAGDGQYFFWRNEELFGPVPLADLVAELNAGTLTKETQVQRDGEQAWVSLGSLIGG